MNPMNILISVLAAMLVVSCNEAAQPTSHVENGKQTRDVLDARVTSCDGLAKEIEDMTQTTAELRKVLRDMAFVTCAVKVPLGAPMTLGPLPTPDCGSDGVAVLVDVGKTTGVPGWICQDRWGHSHEVPK